MVVVSVTVALLNHYSDFGPVRRPLLNSVFRVPMIVVASLVTMLMRVSSIVATVFGCFEVLAVRQAYNGLLFVPVDTE